MADNDLARFYTLTKLVNEGEDYKVRLREVLDNAYDELVLLCPHSEAVDRKSNTRGTGTTRVCKICGITDYASEGGTPGDEYNYGYPGYPSRSFWAGTKVEVVSEEEFHRYSRSHQWVVRNGKPHKRFG